MAGNFPLSLFWVTKGRVMIYVQNNNKYQPDRQVDNSDPVVSVWQFYLWCFHPERGSPFFVQMARSAPPRYSDLHSGDDLSHSRYYWNQNHSRFSPQHSELSSEVNSQKIFQTKTKNIWAWMEWIYNYLGTHYMSLWHDMIWHDMTQTWSIINVIILPIRVSLCQSLIY